MFTILMMVHVLVAIALVALVLLQRGKGADMGAAFGSGASSTVFGSQGSASFLTRTTAGLATVFFITSLSLGSLSGKQPGEITTAVDVGVPAEAVQQPVSQAPAAGTTAAPDVPAAGASTMQQAPAANESAPDVPAIPGGQQ